LFDWRGYGAVDRIAPLQSSMATCQQLCRSISGAVPKTPPIR